MPFIPNCRAAALEKAIEALSDPRGGAGARVIIDRPGFTSRPRRARPTVDRSRWCARPSDVLVQGPRPPPGPTPPPGNGYLSAASSTASSRVGSSSAPRGSPRRPRATGSGPRRASRDSGNDVVDRSAKNSTSSRRTTGGGLPCVAKAVRDQWDRTYGSAPARGCRSRPSRRFQPSPPASRRPRAQGGDDRQARLPDLHDEDGVERRRRSPLAAEEMLQLAGRSPWARRCAI